MLAPFNSEIRKIRSQKKNKHFWRKLRSQKEPKGAQQFSIFTRAPLAPFWLLRFLNFRRPSLAVMTRIKTSFFLILWVVMIGQCHGFFWNPYNQDYKTKFQTQLNYRLKASKGISKKVITAPKNTSIFFYFLDFRSSLQFNNHLKGILKMHTVTGAQFLSYNYILFQSLPF